MKMNLSIQNIRTIVCLANSRKPDGRCLAGKLYTQGKFGSWLRPISIREGEELSEQERQISKGVEPALLDILEFTNFDEHIRYVLEDINENPEVWMLPLHHSYAVAPTLKRTHLMSTS